MDNQKPCDAIHGKNLYICFVSFEERCKGVAFKIKDYDVNQSLILHIDDEPSPEREKVFSELKDLLTTVGKTSVIQTKHGDPITGIISLSNFLQDFKLNNTNPHITLDISTFPRKHLFLTLETSEKRPVSLLIA